VGNNALIVLSDCSCDEAEAVIERREMKPIRSGVDGLIDRMDIVLADRDTELEEILAQWSIVKSVKYRRYPTHKLVVQFVEAVVGGAVADEVSEASSLIVKIQGGTSKFDTLNKHAKSVVQVCFFDDLYSFRFDLCRILKENDLFCGNTELQVKDRLWLMEIRG
jgi:hypothetical protein